jgi:hypothetical protein
MPVRTQNEWPPVVALGMALVPFALFTGHLTILSLAAGTAIWALGEWEAKISPVSYHQTTSVFRVAFNLAGLLLIAHALYRFCRFGFWPISELI